MNFKYVRIQGREISQHTHFQKGIFGMEWRLIKDGVMEEEDADLFREIDDWFKNELPLPKVCEAREKVICYFKTDNAEMMLKMITPAMFLLQKYNHPFDVVYTNFPGEIVYEDKFQIVVKTPYEYETEQNDEAAADMHVDCESKSLK